MSGLLDWLSGIGHAIVGGQSGSDSSTPAAPPNPVINYDPAQTNPVLQSYNDFSSRYRLAQVLNKSGLPGLGALVGPDMSGPAYNQTALASAQQSRAAQVGLLGTLYGPQAKAAVLADQPLPAFPQIPGYTGGSATAGPGTQPAAPPQTLLDSLNRGQPSAQPSAIPIPAPPPGQPAAAPIPAAPQGQPSPYFGPGTLPPGFNPQTQRAAANAAVSQTAPLPGDDPNGAALLAAAGGDQSAPQGAPAPSAQQGRPTMPPGLMQRAYTADLLFPGAGKDLVGKAFPAPENVRPGGAVYDPINNRVLYQQPVLPQGFTYQNGQAVPVPGALAGHAAIANVDQNAILGREQALARSNYGIEYGGGPRGVPLSTGSGPAPASGGAASSFAPTIGTVPPGAAQPVQLAPGAPITDPAKPIATPAGSIVPPIADASPIDMSAANLKDAIPAWNKTRTEWYGQVKSYDIALQRTQAIADAFQKTESGEWATDKAEFAGKLKSAGIDIGNSLGSIKDVQIALKDNWSATLEQLKGISTRGPTEKEIMASSKNFANPDLQPEANHAIVAQTIGTLGWERQMVLDYQKYGTKAQPGAPFGWRNPLDFQTQWTQYNPLPNYVAKAEQTVPAFMGMKGGPVAPGNRPPPGKIDIGSTATGPGGAKIQWDGSKWAPVPKRAGQ